MLDVYFESDKEVMLFCENLFRANKKIDLSFKTHEEWGHQLQFASHVLTHDMVSTISKSMVDVFMDTRLSRMIEKVIKEDYYYSDHDEIERILNLAHGIIHDEDAMNRQDRVIDSVRELILTVIITHIQSYQAIHFDSIITFRLKNIRELLLDYVGLAIDEFKQEEDHQTFIDMLRKYIANKEPLFNEIHILQGTDFTFFKSTGQKISDLELRTIIYNAPLYTVGLDVEELNLAPLIAIAPKRIKIYGEDPADSKTLTIINVFQENAVFESIRHFPFAQINT